MLLQKPDETRPDRVALALPRRVRAQRLRRRPREVRAPRPSPAPRPTLPSRISRWWRGSSRPTRRGTAISSCVAGACRNFPSRSTAAFPIAENSDLVAVRTRVVRRPVPGRGRRLDRPLGLDDARRVGANCRCRRDRGLVPHAVAAQKTRSTDPYRRRVLLPLRPIDLEGPTRGGRGETRGPPTRATRTATAETTRRASDPPGRCGRRRGGRGGRRGSRRA